MISIVVLNEAQKKGYYDGGKSKDIKEIRNETLWGYLRLNPGVSNFTIITYFATQFINGYEMGVLMGYPQYIMGDKEYYDIPKAEVS